MHRAGGALLCPRGPHRLLTPLVQEMHLHRAGRALPRPTPCGGHLVPVPASLPLLQPGALPCEVGIRQTRLQVKGQCPAGTRAVHGRDHVLGPTPQARGHPGQGALAPVPQTAGQCFLGCRGCWQLGNVAAGPWASSGSQPSARPPAAPAAVPGQPPAGSRRAVEREECSAVGAESGNSWREGRAGWQKTLPLGGWGQLGEAAGAGQRAHPQGQGRAEVRPRGLGPGPEGTGSQLPEWDPNGFVFASVDRSLCRDAGTGISAGAWGP